MHFLTNSFLCILLSHGQFTFGYQLPIIIPDEQKVYVREGETLLLNCSAFHYNSLLWFHNGVPLLRDDLSIISSNGSLFLRQITYKDEGVYHCEASNIFGSVSSQNKTVQISYILDKFRVLPRNSEGIEEDGIAMSCGAPLGLPTPLIQWTKDGAFLNSQNDARVSILSSGTLRISSLKTTDEGHYSCLASNPAGQRSAPKVFLKIFRSPSFIRTPKNTTVLLGQNAFLECTADGDPLPTISWTFQNQSLEHRRGKGIQKEENGLLLKNVKAFYEGLYICEASNSIGTLKVSAFLSLSEAPKLINTPFVRTNLSSYETYVELKCSGIGKPKPILLWMREEDRTILLPGDESDHLSVSSSGTLSIRRVLSTSTYFICIVSNVAGSVMARASLILNDPYNSFSSSSSFISSSPSSYSYILTLVYGLGVVNEDAVSLSSTSVKVSWKLKTENRAGDGFYILYKDRSSDSLFNSITVLHSGASSYVVNRLLPFTPYEFLVIPFVRGFSGHPSSLLTSTTHEDFPLGSPSGVSWKQRDDMCINISWNSLSPDAIRGHLLGYEVLIFAIETLVLNDSVTHQWILLSELKDNHIYKVCIRAFNRLGHGPFSDYLYFTPLSQEQLRLSVSQNEEWWIPLLVFSSCSLGVSLLCLGICRHRLHRQKSSKLREKEREFQMLPWSDVPKTTTQILKTHKSNNKQTNKKLYNHNNKQNNNKSIFHEPSKLLLVKRKILRRKRIQRVRSNKVSESSDSDYAYIDRSTDSITGRLRIQILQESLSPYETTNLCSHRLLINKRKDRRYSSARDFTPLRVRSLIFDQINDEREQEESRRKSDNEISDHVYALIESHSNSSNGIPIYAQINRGSSRKIGTQDRSRHHHRSKSIESISRDSSREKVKEYKRVEGSQDEDKHFF